MNDPDVNKFLGELAYAVTKGLTKAVKEKIEKAWLKLEYGVTLNAEEADSLKRIAENDFYLLFKKYLGAHWSLKLIKVGLYISELNDDGKIERTKKLNSEAYQKYGTKGAKIIQIASTGVLVPLMGYIIDLKLNKGANILVLHQEFDKVLEEWDMISTPVTASYSEEMIEEQIVTKMENSRPIFFVYSAGSASKKAQLTIAKMNNEYKFQDKYLLTPKIKVVNNVEYCLWAFEKIEPIEESIISSQIKK